MKKFLAVSVLSLAIATGCSMDLTVEKISEIQAPTTSIQKSGLTGLTSGSSQTGTATGDGVTYYVQTTVGSYMSDMEQTTNDGSYKVYSSVQGGLVTE